MMYLATCNIKPPRGGIDGDERFIRLLVCVGIILALSFLLLNYFAVVAEAKTTLYETDFEDFTVGNINGQDGWVNVGAYEASIRTDNPRSGQKSVRLRSGVGQYDECYKDFATSSQEQGSLEIYFFGETDGGTIFGKSLAGTTKWETKITGTEIWWTEASTTQSLKIGNLMIGGWNKLDVEWCNSGCDATGTRARINEGSWSAWHEGRNPPTINVATARVHLDGTSSPDPFWLDDILITDLGSVACVDIDNEADCYDNGCLWVVSPPLWLDGVCVEWDVYGECGAGESCIWCNSSTTCAENGCYWENDECWWASSSDVVGDWDDYYASNSEFSTPTAFISTIQGFFEPFLGTLAIWINSWEGLFDLSKAQERGTTYGEAIPFARGYLDIIDQFFGGFPISEAFLFFLLVMVVLIIYRVVRQIISLIKPM